MGTRQPSKNERGFTLVELMVVVAIIGILAAFALPNFRKMAFKARRAEAFSALRGISQTEATYHAEHGFYANSFSTLGFDLIGAQVATDGTLAGGYYTYTLQTMDLGNGPGSSFRATATGDIDPTDSVLDIIIIEN